MNTYDASVTGIVLRVIAYVVLAPLAGGLLAGLDRKVSAWMQGRVGPPVLQPFYDVSKLFRKEKIAVNPFQNFFVFLFFLFMIFTGSLFFAGAKLLIVVFVLVLAEPVFRTRRLLGQFAIQPPGRRTRAHPDDGLRSGHYYPGHRLLRCHRELQRGQHLPGLPGKDT